jgi:hypothetical protein
MAITGGDVLPPPQPVIANTMARSIILFIDASHNSLYKAYFFIGYFKVRDCDTAHTLHANEVETANKT